MSHRWPLLDVYKVRDSEALIRRCLHTLDGLTLIEQFRARNVRMLCMRPLLIHGILGSTSEEGFTILLDSEITDDTIHCQTIGHELAHTFQFDPITWSRLAADVGDEWKTERERFAQAFGERWLASSYGRMTELRQLLNYCFPEQRRKNKNTEPVRLWF